MKTVEELKAMLHERQYQVGEWKKLRIEQDEIEEKVKAAYLRMLESGRLYKEAVMEAFSVSEYSDFQ